MHECAICRHTGRAPRSTMNVVVVATALPDLLEGRVGGQGSERQGEVAIAACPEHVVEVYRGRVEGVRMVLSTPIERRWRTPVGAGR